MEMVEGSCNRDYIALRPLLRAARSEFTIYSILRQLFRRVPLLQGLNMSFSEDCWGC